MMGVSRHVSLPILIAAALALGACAQSKLALHTVKKVAREVSPKAPPAPPAEPESVGAVKIGDPYEVKGVWYYPQPEPNYDATGIASWYGEPFHGRPTANGETYDMNALTAAHKTLPLPTYVNVTNLENGRSIRVRVNDRGPFVHGRLIDLSRRASQLLGFERAGTARVRVRVASASTGALVIAKPVTPEEERTAIAAVPRVAVSAAPLPPPGAAAALSPEPAAAASPPAPAPALAAPVAGTATRGAAEVTVVPVRPTRLFVQAGAFSFYDNARRLGAKLARVGPTNISAATVNGQHFYRVRIGPLKTLDLADATLEQVIRSGYPGARIVVD